MASMLVLLILISLVTLATVYSFSMCYCAKPCKALPQIIGSVIEEDRIWVPPMLLVSSVTLARRQNDVCQMQFLYEQSAWNLHG